MIENQKKMSKIKVNEKEFWALKNAISDKIYNLNSVVDRTDKKKRSCNGKSKCSTKPLTLFQLST